MSSASTLLYGNRFISLSALNRLYFDIWCMIDINSALISVLLCRKIRTCSWPGWILDGYFHSITFVVESKKGPTTWQIGDCHWHFSHECYQEIKKNWHTCIQKIYFVMRFDEFLLSLQSERLDFDANENRKRVKEKRWNEISNETRLDGLCTCRE